MAEAVAELPRSLDNAGDEVFVIATGRLKGGPDARRKGGKIKPWIPLTLGNLVNGVTNPVYGLFIAYQPYGNMTRGLQIGHL